jgi:tetratricopeptide (TPR) repeat protein
VNPQPGRLGGRAVLALALLALLPFLNGLTADFTYDDKFIVRDNPRLSSPERVGEAFTSHYFGGPLATAKNYRPVVLLTYAVQRWTSGKDPFPFHVVNVLLHVGTTLLFAAWLLALGMPRGPSLAAAALFAVLPIHVEAVTGIVGRAELLVAFLVFLAALLFRRATDGARLRAIPYAGALAAFLLAVFTKENAVILPGVVVLGELLRRDSAEPLPARLRRKALAAAGLLAPLAAFAAVRLFALGGLLSKKAAFFELDNPLAPLSHLLRAANGLWLLLRYVAKTFVPLGLSADHSAHALDLIGSLADPRAAASLAGVVLLVAVGLASVRRQPLVSLGVAFALGAFLPTSNVLFPIGTIFGERLAYLPSAGLVAAAAGLVTTLGATSPGFRASLLGVALATYSAATVARNEVFRDDDRLFADMVEKVPRSARARYNVAYVGWGRGETGMARRHLEKAVGLFPRYYDAWALLGRVEAKEERWPEARASCREAVRIKPDYELGWNALAQVEEESGRFAEAERALTEGLRRCPRSRPLLSRRAALLHGRGRLEEARAAWRAAVGASDGGAAARLGLARTLSALGRDDEAVKEARRALASSPGFLEARYFLAERYEAAGKSLPAAAELARASRGAPRDPKPARLLFELGARAPEARNLASSALARVEATFGCPARNLALRDAIASFRAAAAR